MNPSREESPPAPLRMAAIVLAFLLGAWIPVAAHADEGENAPQSASKLEFEGKNFFATAKGTFHEWRILESRIDLEALEDSFAVVEVILGSVDTGIDRRDEHLLTADFFEIETFPVATARAHSLVAVGESEAGAPRFTAQFDISLHGVEKTLPGEVELVSETPIVFEGTLVLDRTEFGVGTPESRWNPMSVDSEIPIRFRVEL
jgi:polyisoprenoid-binding protein YceI